MKCKNHFSPVLREKDYFPLFGIDQTQDRSDSFRCIRRDNCDRHKISSTKLVAREIGHAEMGVSYRDTTNGRGHDSPTKKVKISEFRCELSVKDRPRIGWSQCERRQNLNKNPEGGPAEAEESRDSGGWPQAEPRTSGKPETDCRAESVCNYIANRRITTGDEKELRRFYSQRQGARHQACPSKGDVGQCQSDSKRDEE
jgi:hypothetical protein